MMLRYFIHVFQDIHQPLHAIDGISPEFPRGDIGATLWLLRCNDSQFLNDLHAFWDSAGGQYTDREPIGVVLATGSIDAFRPTIVANASSIRQRHYNLYDHLKLKRLDDMSFDEARRVLVEEERTFRGVVRASFEIAKDEAYSRIDLRRDAEGRVPCPNEYYQKKAMWYAERRMHLAGYRLSFLLRLLGKQAVALGLVV